MEKQRGFNCKIVGREQEKDVLKAHITSNRAEFIAIYGRRRVGKTFLVKNYATLMADVFLHMTGIQKGSLKSQLEEFAKQLGTAFYRGAAIAPRTSWKDAFEDLTKAIDSIPKDQRIVIFLDELPWMATPRSKLLGALELYWNRYWSFDSRVNLIICGSATSWIIDKVINSKGGLHNRVTRSIHLKPFTLYEISCFLESNKISLDHRQTLDLYIVLGGIPLYWTYVQKGLSAHQTVERLCFQSGGPLVQEFPRLFDSLFEDPEPYKNLIRTIAKHRYGIGRSELLSKAKTSDGGGATRRLVHLEEAGFITSLIPYGHKDKGTYYVLDDEYSLFYLSWIEPKMKTILKKRSNKGYWLSQANSPAWNAWVGYAFEAVCYKHLDQIRHALGIDPGATPGTWRYIPRKKSKFDGAQVDLLFDRLDGVITLCEIKYSDQPFAINKSYAQDLLRKMSVFQNQTRTQKQLFLAMITVEGLKPTMYSEEIITNEIVWKDLFRDIV